MIFMFVSLPYKLASKSIITNSKEESHSQQWHTRLLGQTFCLEAEKLNRILVSTFLENLKGGENQHGLGRGRLVQNRETESLATGATLCLRQLPILKANTKLRN